MNNNQLNTNRSSGYQANNMTINNHTYSNVIKNKSIIAEVINIIATLPVESISYTTRALPEEVEKKILHNKLTRCKYIIEIYKSHNKDLDNAYYILEQERPGRKQKLSANINSHYKQELNKLNEKHIEDIVTTQEWSDSILENIIKNLNDKVLASSNLNAYNEDIEKALNLIVANAFIECLILENPQEIK